MVVVYDELTRLQLVEGPLPLQLLHHDHWQVQKQLQQRGEQQQEQHQQQEEQLQEEACLSDQPAWLQPLHAGAALPACRRERKKCTCWARYQERHDLLLDKLPSCVSETGREACLQYVLHNAIKYGPCVTAEQAD